MAKSPATRMSIAGMLRRELTEAKAYQRKKEKYDTVSGAFVTKTCFLRHLPSVLLKFKIQRYG